MKNFKTVKSNRKTIGIYILPDASVEVRCPKNADMNTVNEFVEKKSAWIEKAVGEKKRALAEKQSFLLASGAQVYFLGKPLTVRISHVHHIDDSGFYISGKNLRQSAENLYRRYAKSILTQKVEYFSKIMSCSPTSVKINGARTRWGSCSGKNALNFSWTLISADEEAVDYVVVHELAHTIEHNHSARFWAIVEKYMPDYQRRRKLLENAQKFIYKL